MLISDNKNKKIKRKAQQSPQMPKNKYQKNKRKKQQKLSDETDQISNNLSTNMIATCSQKQSNDLC